MAARTSVRVLSASMIVAGLALPVVARAVVPLLRPRDHYQDTLARMAAEPLMFAGVCVWTTIPFVSLALFALFDLRPPAGATVFRRRLIGVGFAFALMWSLGFVIHIPQTAPGANFGLALFPLYALLIMLPAYGVGRMLALLDQTFKRNRV